MKDKSKSYIFWIGTYLNKVIVAERGLPTCNVAGSNRLQRFAEALNSTGQRVIIFSPAVSLRVRYRGKLIHPKRTYKSGKTLVLFCCALGLPIAGILLEPIFLITALYAVYRKHRPEAVVIYNYSPSLVLAALFIKLWWRVPLIENLEDIAIPKRSDWLATSETRPVQQLIYSVCMALIINLSNKIIIPTKRFTLFIPPDKPRLLITGCITVKDIAAKPTTPKTERDKINVLFTGRIEFEYGIQYFLKALKMLSENEALAGVFRIHICGKGSKERWVSEYLQHLNNIEVNYYGFVRSEIYQGLLSVADVCVALQDPKGRLAYYNTPSKAYEYLGYGKMVIATDVGDLALLPPEAITICSPLSEQKLYEKLIDIAQNPQRIVQQSKAAASYAKKFFAYEVVGPKIRDFILRRR